MTEKEAVLADDYTLEEMAKLMGIKVVTLKSRISRGTDHPPFRKRGNVIVFPVRMFKDWLNSQPVHCAVKNG